jgi:hypothetical protein
MERWGFWEWLAYSGLLVGAVMVAYETALNTSPHIAAKLPSLAASGLGFVPLALLILSGAVFLLQRLGVLPHGGKGKTPEVYPFAWRGPGTALIPVVREKFFNTKVLLDGHSYTQCTFENVTFVYNGTAIFQLSRNKMVGSMMFTSDNPAVEGTFLLLQGLGILPADFRVEHIVEGGIPPVTHPKAQGAAKPEDA